MNRRIVFRNLIMFATALSLWTVWLPMMRTLSGQNSYAWGNEYFNHMYRGQGWSGDYLFLVYQAILGVTVLWMGFRNPRAPFQVLLVIWNAIPFANALYLPLVLGQENLFIGDTGGVSWDLTWIAPMVTGALFFATLLWIGFERKYACFQPPRWTTRNSKFGAAFIGCVILAIALEWMGAAHGATDMIAVPLNVLTPLLIALMFYPWPPESAYESR